MVYLRSRLDVADNSGARMATMIGVIGKGTAQSARLLQLTALLLEP